MAWRLVGSHGLDAAMSDQASMDRMDVLLPRARASTVDVVEEWRFEFVVDALYVFVVGDRGEVDLRAATRIERNGVLFEFGSIQGLCVPLGGDSNSHRWRRFDGAAESPEGMLAVSGRVRRPEAWDVVAAVCSMGE